MRLPFSSVDFVTRMFAAGACLSPQYIHVQQAMKEMVVQSYRCGSPTSRLGCSSAFKFKQVRRTSPIFLQEETLRRARRQRRPNSFVGLPSFPLSQQGEKNCACGYCRLCCGRGLILVIVAASTSFILWPLIFCQCQSQARMNTQGEGHHVLMAPFRFLLVLGVSSAAGADPLDGAPSPRRRGVLGT